MTLAGLQGRAPERRAPARLAARAHRGERQSRAEARIGAGQAAVAPMELGGARVQPDQLAKARLRAGVGGRADAVGMHFRHRAAEGAMQLLGGTGGRQPQLRVELVELRVHHILRDRHLSRQYRTKT